MALSESEVKTDMVRDIKKAGAYARRIEDKYAVGILDTIIVWPGLPVLFCEVKIVRDNLYHPSPRQFVEGGRILAANGEGFLRYAAPLLVGFKDGTFYTPIFWVDTADIRSPALSAGSITDFLEAFYQWNQERLQDRYLTKPRESLRPNVATSTEGPKTPSV